MTQLFKFAASSTWLALTILSLVPGQERPHTGMGGNYEHILAYALSAIVAKIAFRHVETRYLLIAYSGASAVFEIAQIWIPGRHPGYDNWLASSAGAVIGLSLGWLFTHKLAWQRVLSL